MKNLAFAAAVTALLSASAMAQYNSATHEQRQAQRLEQRKAEESASHQARIGILQTADNCVKGATTPTAYRACEQQERASRQAFHSQQEAQHQQRRAEHEQHRAERMARMQQH